MRNLFRARDSALYTVQRIFYILLYAFRYKKSSYIAPGIIVGRLQKEEFIQYNSLNDLKVQYDLDEQ